MNILPTFIDHMVEAVTSQLYTYILVSKHSPHGSLIYRSRKDLFEILIVSHDGPINILLPFSPFNNTIAQPYHIRSGAVGILEPITTEEKA